MATVLPNVVLARHLQRLESFVTDRQQQHVFPNKPALETCRARCQHMSNPLLVLLNSLKLFLVLKVM